MSWLAWSPRAVLPVLAALSVAVAPLGAWAQDEDPPGDGDLGLDMGGFSGSFDLNSVLVASFEADQPFLEPEAERVRGLVTDALGEAYVAVAMAEVADFEDYTAEVYLRSCPDGQYIGCVFVVGERARTDWTVGGRVGAVEGGYQVDLSFIDVAAAKLVLEFDVVLDGSNDAEFQEGVLKIMDALVAGEVQDLDVRGDPAARRAAEREQDERQARARDFAAGSVYEDPGDFDRGDVGLDAYAGEGGGDDRLTFQDLEEMEGAGGLTPWERVGLTKGQYKIYRNSGKKLRDFKARLQGRKGEILVKAGMVVGAGSLAQRHETWFALDNRADVNNIQAGDILDQALVQAQERGLGFGGQLELAVGLVPWMELGLFGNAWSAPYRYRFQREVEGIEGDRAGFEEASPLSVQGGLRLGFVPMPAYPVRPTFHVGASYWQGSKVTRLQEVPGYLQTNQLRANNLVFVHAQPGFEAAAGKVVLFWAKFDLDVPVVGRSAQAFNLAQEGFAGTLSARPEQPGAPAIGFGGSFGVAFRIRVAGMR